MQIFRGNINFHESFQENMQKTRENARGAYKKFALFPIFAFRIFAKMEKTFSFQP